jgi:hypothetical protein
MTRFPEEIDALEMVLRRPSETSFEAKKPHNEIADFTGPPSQE